MTNKKNKAHARIKVQVSGLTRVKNTESGNPRWLIHTKEDGLFRTEPDGDVANHISESLIDKTVYIYMGTRGTAVKVEEIDPASGVRTIVGKEMELDGAPIKVIRKIDTTNHDSRYQERVKVLGGIYVVENLETKNTHTAYGCELGVSL